MSDNSTTQMDPRSQAPALPTPDPALRKLDRFIGTWHMHGRTTDTVYPSMVGSPLPYRWKLDGDEVTIVAEALHATFHGRWSEDGQTFSGGWRPDPGHENDPGNIAYDVSGGRARN